MDAIIRALIVYLFLLVLFRVAGKRTMAQVTTFDFILLLIIGDIVQPALLGNNNSLMAALLVILTIVGTDILLSLLKQKSKTIEKLLDGTPVVVAANGKMIKERAEKERVDEDDVLEEARKYHGIERMEQIKYAVLERSGCITIVPFPSEG
jgi:uncharacterized membrane protein YcaP (DUF421 family)